MIGLAEASARFGFIPFEFSSGAWRDDAVRAVLSPLASAFFQRDILGAVFNGVFVLIAGRFVEKAIGPVGLAVVFVAGCYAGALLRLILTPESVLPSAGFTPALFAIVGAYLMLYGVPQALPVPRNRPRVVQIGILALFWLLVQVAFSIAARSFEISVSILDPLGGLVAGLLLARPLMAWRYRGA